MAPHLIAISDRRKFRMQLIRFCVLSLVGVLLLAGVADAQTQPVKVGVLKLTSSASIFVGVEKGFFKEAGIEPELVYFQAAAPIATALAAGQLDVGATGLTAALYNIVLGGEKLWIVADKGREWPGYPLVAIVVQRELWDGGLRSIKDLKGKRIGVTQIGSTFHYHIGNVLEKEGLNLSDVKIVPLQAMSATMEALKGKQVDAILVPQPFPGAAEAQGFGKIMAWAGDLYPWQIAAVFYSQKLAADRARAVAFMKGYVKASRYYFDAALVQKDGRRVPGANYDEVVAITAKYTGARPEIIRLGFPFQDRNGRLLVPDIERQMSWWVANGFMKKPLPLKSIVDTSFLEEAVKALDR
jgi:NitT/TauT family transport system substrate-binding protein